MKAFLLSVLLISTTAVAEEERSLGKSPDGKFERLLRASSPDDDGWANQPRPASRPLGEKELRDRLL